MSLLTGLNIIDLTSRLPGPLATYLLQDLGANVTKVESVSIADPFSEKENLKHSPAFLDWYKNLNKDKKIIKLDFENEKSKLAILIENADIIIAPFNRYFEVLLKNYKIKVLIKIAGGKDEWKSLHDLNALAISKSFSLHLQESQKPPYLPFAGISFGAMIANTSLAGYIHFLKTHETTIRTIFLKESFQTLMQCFESESFKSHPYQLHNGALPCYNIYQTKDENFLCLAAVEPKYWIKFVELFNLPLDLEARMDKSGKTLQIIQNKFAMLPTNEIRSIVGNEDICLNFIE